MVNVLPLSIPAAGVTISLSASRATVAVAPLTVTQVTVIPRKSRLNSDRSWVALDVTAAVDVIVLATGS